MGKDVIIALDFDSREKTLAFLDRFADEERKPFVKIGMELYYAEGPSIVREIKARGHKIFLDLKLHDIPNTVKKAMAVLSGLDVDMTNLHAAGTKAMMEAALEGLTRPDGTRPLLIAVTQLTSTSQERMEQDLLIEKPLDQVVMHYAKCAADAGLAGVVCSPLEAGKVHVPHSHPRRAVRRRRGGGPGPGHHPRQGKGDRFRLYRGGPSHHPGGGPRSGVPPVRGGICRISPCGIPFCLTWTAP